jgi:hypothetical protein
VYPTPPAGRDKGPGLSTPEDGALHLPDSCLLGAALLLPPAGAAVPNLTPAQLRSQATEAQAHSPAGSPSPAT